MVATLLIQHWRLLSHGQCCLWRQITFVYWLQLDLVHIWIWILWVVRSPFHTFTAIRNISGHLRWTLLRPLLIWVRCESLWQLWLQVGFLDSFITSGTLVTFAFRRAVPSRMHRQLLLWLLHLAIVDIFIISFFIIMTSIIITWLISWRECGLICFSGAIDSINQTYVGSGSLSSTCFLLLHFLFFFTLFLTQYLILKLIKLFTK